jgi:nicotinate-nucleotide pyrophosphorylase (carboxylating)
MRGKQLEEKLLEMVYQDTGVSDITTSFTPEKTVKAEIIAKGSGVVSGIDELCVLFKLFGIGYICKIPDGGKVKKSDRILLLQGNSRDLLIAERTALNILSRMSGISTLTRQYVDKASKANPKIRIAATRKTTPSFGFFEKKAVRLGGGDTHRLGLGDEVLIKDNHLRLFGSVKEALKKARQETSFAHKIELEVTRPDEALEAAAYGADIILLDNMSVADVRKTVLLLEKKGLRGMVLIEASGGITFENVAEYAKTGADILSIGRLTHSAPALDISLEII